MVLSIKFDGTAHQNLMVLPLNLMVQPIEFDGTTASNSIVSIEFDGTAH